MDIPDQPITIFDLPEEILRVILASDMIGRFGCTVMSHVCKQTNSIVRGNTSTLFLYNEVPLNMLKWATDSGYTIMWSYTPNLVLISRGCSGLSYSA